VILVGHSYAGMVITGVAERVPDRIAHLVYLDAFVPEDGKSLMDYQPPEMAQMFRERTQAEGEGYKLPAVIPPEVFGVTDEDDLAWAAPRMDPHPFKTKLDPVCRRDLRASLVPRTFVYCNSPAAGPFGQFAEKVRNDPAWGYLEMPTGHSVMITHPGLLADFLLGLAAPASAGERPLTSLEGPVTLVDGELQLRIPLAAGGSELIEVTQTVSRVEGDHLVVVIPDWLAAKLSISAGSIVHVDDSEGGFNIWPLQGPC
jgi:pimeloyl-ACP methyl ester carboxylesterase